MPNYFNILFMLYTKASYESSNHSDECKQILARKSLNLNFNFPVKFKLIGSFPYRRSFQKAWFISLDVYDQL